MTDQTTAGPAAPGPLTGVRVVDFTQAVAGPFAGRILADLGADVVKLEPKTGDLVRALAPVGDGEFSAMFNHANAGKRGVIVDLKSEGGRRIALELVEKADVVLENFTPGVMDRLGLGYDDLRAVNPSIVMCSVSSYGQFGSHSGYVGADPVGQAMSGMVAMTGDPGRPPYLVTNGIADTSTGTHAALSILAALLSRQRTGQGCHLDISMCDVMLFMDCCNVPWALATRGSVPMERSGPHNLTVSPFGVFAASDGYVLIEAWGEGPKSLWGRLATLMGQPELIDDPDFRTNDARIRNRPAVTAVIEKWLATRTRDEAMEQLYAARVVAAPVLSPYEATRHTVARERAMVQPISYGSLGRLDAVANPYHGTPWAMQLRPSPLPGQHSVDVLTNDLGLSAEEAARLVADGVVEQQRAADE